MATPPPASPLLDIRGSAVILDTSDRVLMVQPTGAESYELPGGVAEPGEEDWQAMARSVRTQLGLVVSPFRLLAKDFLPAQAEGGPVGYTFVYDCGRYAYDTPIVVPGGETGVAGYAWVAISALEHHCRPEHDRLVMAALTARTEGTTAVLRRGAPAYAVEG
ncbi:NUDIX hydrolase [Streptomyces sp. NPDC003077]|uniref:NUDIX hydrolase n=1 Tax=Streptomyces sp. NPDC003077 TaxID=3154443 RepID=UPI0033AA4062